MALALIYHCIRQTANAKCAFLYFQVWEKFIPITSLLQHSQRVVGLERRSLMCLQENSEHILPKNMWVCSISLVVCSIFWWVLSSMLADAKEFVWVSFLWWYDVSSFHMFWHSNLCTYSAWHILYPSYCMQYKFYNINPTGLWVGYFVMLSIFRQYNIR
jgi:hypothetical protein